MGNIQILGKWDLETGKWNYNPIYDQYGRSIAIVNYEKIINSNDKINYIIITQGSRVEDHSKDFLTVKEREVRIDNIIKHYKNKNCNYAIKLLFMDADAPIIEDAKLFSKYIDSLAQLETTNSINIISLSKCSIMNFYVPSFFTTKIAFDKTNIYNLPNIENYRY